MTTDDSRSAIATDPGDVATPGPMTRTAEATTSRPAMVGSRTEDPSAADGQLSNPGPGTLAQEPTAESAAGDSLIALEHAEGYRARWTGVQGDFIDEPRTAVSDADALVGEMLDELAVTFRLQREALEQQWDDNASSTEDLRVAMRRYRTFFDRLLAL